MQIIELVGRVGVEPILPEMSDELLSHVRTAVDDAPTSDEDWADSRPIIGGTFTDCYDQAAAEQQWRATYRAGVEALRRLFAASGMQP